MDRETFSYLNSYFNFMYIVQVYLPELNSSTLQWIPMHASSVYAHHSMRSLVFIYFSQVCLVSLTFSPHLLSPTALVLLFSDFDSYSQLPPFLYQILILHAHAKAQNILRNFPFFPQVKIKTPSRSVVTVLF